MRKKITLPHQEKTALQKRPEQPLYIARKKQVEVEQKPPANSDYFTQILLNNAEVALLIFQRLSIRDLVHLFRVSRTFRSLSCDQSLWRKHTSAWRYYLLLPFRTTTQCHKKNHIFEFKDLYLSTAQQRRSAIETTLSHDQDKTQLLQQKAITPFRGFGLQQTWMYPLLRDQCIINASLDGDIDALIVLRCTMQDIKKLALISRCKHSYYHQTIYDFFWMLVLSTDHYEPLTRNLGYSELKQGGLTLAHWAAMLNQSEALKKYLQAHPQHALLPNMFGITPLEWAEYFQYENCIRILTHKKQTLGSEIKPTFTFKKLRNAIEVMDLESSLVLLNRNDDLTYEELKEFTISSAARGFIEYLYLLLIFFLNSSHQEHKDLALLAAAGHGHWECVHLLLQHNANPNVYNDCLSPLSTREPYVCGDRGDTALTFATKGGYIRCVRLLLENISNKDAKNFRGDTALIRAAYRGYTDILKLLVQYGANPHVTDDYGNTTVMGAARGGHNECLQILLALGVDPNRKNRFGDTPLIRAANRGHLSCLEQLLNTGADPLFKNNEGRTALDLSIKRSHQDCACLLAVAMFLLSSITKKSSYSSNLFSQNNDPISSLIQAKDYSPDYFQKLMKRLIEQSESNIWVTQEMRSHLLKMEVVYQLNDIDIRIAALTQLCEQGDLDQIVKQNIVKQILADISNTEGFTLAIHKDIIDNFLNTLNKSTQMLMSEI